MACSRHSVSLPGPPVCFMNGHQIILGSHCLRGLCVEAGGEGGGTQDPRTLCTGPGSSFRSLLRGPGALHDASLLRGPSGQIRVAELKPVISFSPGTLSLVLSRDLFCSCPSFSRWLRFVAAEQGVFLKAARLPSPVSRGGCLFTWVALLPGLAPSSPRLNLFSP